MVLNIIFLSTVSYHNIKVVPETGISFFCKDSVLQFVYLQLIHFYVYTVLSLEVFLVYVLHLHRRMCVWFIYF